MASSLPIPPFELANRVGSLGARQGYEQRFDQIGAETRGLVDFLLPPDWSWPGKRVLDFGCGVGRTLRHFADEAAAGAEFVGCDIDAESIAWVRRELPAGFQAFQNQAEPPIAQPDGGFDLIYAMSVFTHLDQTWSRWLLEMRRLLKPGGRLIATYLGASMSEAIAGEPWDESRVGMNILRGEQSWELGGPSVLLSEWWLREHWGRVFELEHVWPAETPGMQSVVVGIPLAQAPPTVEELEAIDPADPREIDALRHNVRQVNRDLEGIRRAYEDSLSWRLGAPLRAASARLRARRPH